MDENAPPPMPSSPAEPPVAATSEDKTVAIVCYLTFIGFIVAIVLHSNKKTRLGAFHLRQMLGFVLTSICASFLMIIPILGWIAAMVLFIGIFVFWIMGVIAAINGQMKPAPLVGPLFQQWFGNTFD